MLALPNNVPVLSHSIASQAIRFGRQLTTERVTRLRSQRLYMVNVTCLYLLMMGLLHSIRRMVWSVGQRLLNPNQLIQSMQHHPQFGEILWLLCMDRVLAQSAFKVNKDGTHDLVWKDRRVLDSQFNSLLSHEGYLYGFTAKRAGGSAFRCIDFATGKLQWSVNSDLQRDHALR